VPFRNNRNGIDGRKMTTSPTSSPLMGSPNRNNNNKPQRDATIDSSNSASSSKHDDENEYSISSTSSTTSVVDHRSNTLVAESDLHALLEAMDERMEELLTKVSSSTNNPLDPAAERQREYLLQCRDSLRQNIGRIVEPISDEAFHMYRVQASKNNNESSLPIINASIHANGNDEKVESVVEHDEKEEENDDDDDDYEWDEEDLLDPQALQRVRELRQEARTQAAHVQAIRNEVVQKALDLAERQVQLLRRRQAPKIGPRVEALSTASAEGDTNGSNENEDSVPQRSAAYVQVSNKVSEMHRTLSQLSSSLEKQAKEIPQTLICLQETVSVVEESLSRRQQPTLSLSQTEQAILRREEGVATALVMDWMPLPPHVSAATPPLSQPNVSPEERLALFLQQ